MLRSVKYGVNGAVLAGLIAVPVLWGGVDKSVSLVVDGRTRVVHTTAADVGQVVRSAGYRVTSHDLLAPDVHSAVHDGGHIVLQRGRLLELSVDGRGVAVWTTARTVSDALSALGYSAADFVSVSRSQRLPLTRTTDIAIRTPRSVTLVHDGQHQQVVSTAPTVAAMLSEVGVTLGAQDRLSVPASSALADGATITVQRVTTRSQVQTVKVPFSIAKHTNSAIDKGTSIVTTKGRAGAAKVTWSLVYVDGRLAVRSKLKTVAMRSARAEVIEVGTKKVVVATSSGSSSGKTTSGSTVANAPTPSAGSAKAIAKAMLAARGWSDQYSCLVTLWNHESGWRVHAANPSGAYGIPQALPGSKMSSAGSDWQDSAATQIKWGLGYIAARYNTPCEAWATWQAHGGWY